MQLEIFTTGGTIDKVYFDAKSAFEVGEPQIVEVLREANLAIEYTITPLLRKDSLDLTDLDRADIRQAVLESSSSKIVITHGTDTMIDTAKALVGIPGKSIVLTGAMQPARFHLSDAVFNIAGAIIAAQTLPVGVYIAMNGRIFTPHMARKNQETNQFEDIIND